MARAHIHRDATIYVEGPAGLWVGDRREYQLDFGRPAEVSPGEERYYEPGIVYWIQVGDRRVRHPLPWAAGDIALARLEAALAARDARVQPDPGELDFPALTRSALAALMDALIDERIAAGTASQAEIAYAAARGAP